MMRNYLAVIPFSSGGASKTLYNFRGSF